MNTKFTGQKMRKKCGDGQSHHNTKTCKLKLV